MIAIAELYQVNILVINDKGYFYLGARYNAKAKRALMIAYKNGNHYDTVSNVEASMLIKICEDAIESEKKWILFEKEIQNCNQIVYEIE